MPNFILARGMPFRHQPIRQRCHFASERPYDPYHTNILSVRLRRRICVKNRGAGCHNISTANDDDNVARTNRHAILLTSKSWVVLLPSASNDGINKIMSMFARNANLIRSLSLLWRSERCAKNQGSEYTGIITFTNHGCKVMAVTALPSVPCNFLSWQAKHTIRFSAG